MALTKFVRTALEVFTIFRGVKERDAAYERAVHEAQVQFRKCPGCGKWVCPAFCWNGDAGMCERCAPDEREAAIQRGVRRRIDRAFEDLDSDEIVGPTSCPACGVQTRGAPFCHICGLALHAPRCVHCDEALAPDARYCGQCGRAQP